MSTGKAQLVLLLTRAILHTRLLRRKALFWITLAALAQVALGGVEPLGLAALLREHPFFFLFYWGGCAWLTLTAALLALYDLLRTRQELRGE